QGAFKAGEEIQMRVYLNHKTYFPIAVKIKHTTVEQSEGVTRHGTEFLKSAENNAALQHFVKFIETVSLGLKKDEGDLMAPKIS
ncbi:MAG: PilZ domain-containing protein, partial [Bdellovibrionaceae bacterium]|nr:PilZ domain-containing protein [Pseudobdellovibrionaceae bacterium]